MTNSFSGEYADEKAVIEQVENIQQLHSQIDTKAEKRLLRKLDFIILPQVTLLFLFNFIDRSAIGNAQPAGFAKDVHLKTSPPQLNIALMIFYIFYIIIEIPSNLILKKIGSVWLSILCLCFGAVTIGSAFISNFGEFVGVRILLGIFEGGVIPGIVYLLTRFYTRAELAFRIGVFLSWGPGLSGAFGGLLAAGLLNAKVADLVRWEKIFVVEGIITMSLGLITIFTLPTSPEKTKWLNEEERALAVRRLEIEHLGTTHEPTTPRLVLKACLNWRTWLAVAGYSFINVIVQGTSIFLPTIINGLGKYSATQVQLRTVPPYIVASAWAFGISYCAWKTRVHGYFVAGSTVLSIVGYIMFLASKDPKVLYGASFLTFTGALPCGPLFLAWATANAGTPTARAVTSAIVPAWGSIGSIICTWLYLPQYKPRYIPGNAFNVFSAAISCVIGLTCSLYASWENKQREAGRRDWRLDGKSEQEIKELGEMHPNYRLMR
ncbi:major facilitator superfamily protein [Rhodotorula toruloides]|uniref:BY PROTMAP: gi/472588352/gb/EMS25824.1/ major facilitator superfamily protein [Rhodosporidium toruloides NP11] gi/647396143/emb/CDR38166.1/ RHTO0S03e04918g1_1 [Rhodosporidium toruloides] n=1 Tax=Rhodotorula toruloides TaxID=5286 RepID=A0A0K3C8K7_RHOTO|nr:major facilitator superfamily protein [Rhodotorula toruloides]